MSKFDLGLNLAFGTFLIAIGWAAAQVSIMRAFGALLALAAAAVFFEYLAYRLQRYEKIPRGLALWIRYSAIPVMMACAMTVLFEWDWWFPLAAFPLLALTGGIIAIAEHAQEARWIREHPDSGLQ